MKTAEYLEGKKATENFTQAGSSGADHWAIHLVGVIGAGTMGNGIATFWREAVFDVVLCDVEQRFLDRGLATIAKNLDREVAKNKITADDKTSQRASRRCWSGRNSPIAIW